MKKKIISVLLTLALLILIIFFYISEKNKGINLYIKNDANITIDNVSIYLYNSEDNITIYSTDNLNYLTEKHYKINIKKYPKEDYSIKVNFTVSGEKSENIIAYMPSTNGVYNLNIKVKELNNHITANIMYKDSFQEINNNITLK